MGQPAPTGLQVRPLIPGDEPQMRQLFREVFSQELSPALQHWKYADGRGRAWGAWGGDGDDDKARLLVHCGVFFRDVMVAGQMAKIAQLGDLMASNRKPGGLARQDSPFLQVIREVLDSLASPANPDALAFGFPSERAMRLGEHLGVFCEIDKMFDLTFAPHPRPWWGDTWVELAETDLGVVSQVWQPMASDLDDGLVGVRDAGYIAHRYFHHPVHRYRCLLVRGFGWRRPLGVIVVKGEAGQRELMDVIGPLRHLPRMVRAAQGWLAETGGQQLHLWLASSHVDRLAALAHSVKPLEFRIMANPFSPAPFLSRFAKRWWLTSGDTDYL